MQKIKILFAALLLSFSLFSWAGEPVKATPVNLNTATVAELVTLSGIGQSKAEAIIEYRKQIGSFKNINEITMVKGIGNATFEKNKDRLTIK